MPAAARSSARHTHDGSWVAAFRAATVDPHETLQLVVPRAFDDETVRQVIRPAGGGSAARVTLTNRYGLSPLAVGRASVAVRAAGAAVVPGSDRPLRFAGATSVTIPPGGEVVSDPVGLAVRPGVDLALSLYLPEPTGLATYQADPRERAYVVPGDRAGATELAGPGADALEELETRSFVAGVDVLAPRREPVVVTFGDSFVEGTGTTLGANRRISDRLTERLTRGWAVNTGIAGNRLLVDEVGESALARLDRDVLAVPGVAHVLVHVGINDLGLPGTVGEARPGADDLVAGLAQLAARVREAGLTVVGTTLGPTGSVSYAGYDAPEVRRAGAEVDEWVRRSRAFDAVVDVSAILADPTRPGHLRRELDSGDGLHFNDAGAREIADAVDLAALTGAAGRRAA